MSNTARKLYPTFDAAQAQIGRLELTVDYYKTREKHLLATIQQVRDLTEDLE